MNRQEPKVLYIVGYSRSGSTLLDCMLGEIPGFFSTGELAYIWTHGLRDNQLCGCGERFLSCPFWEEVGRRAFGGWSTVDLPEMLALEQSVNRHRYIHLLLLPRMSREFEANLHRYAEMLGRIYEAIAAVAPARVIIDSSIDPAYGFLLRHVPGIDLRVIHMIRDSRATAFSWTRWQRKTDRVDSAVYQRRFRPSATAVRWDVYHLLAQLLSRLQGPELRVRYESFVREPRAVVSRVLEHADERPAGVDLSFIGENEVSLSTNHTVAGSLMRLRSGSLPVRLDAEWEEAFEPMSRRVVTLLTSPLLRLYGYRDGGDGVPPVSSVGVDPRHG
jgi:hypothetical protein